MSVQIDLTDPYLFGNDAGEDEDPDFLASYFVEKPSFRVFTNPSAKIAIARARKGLGKSALLSKVARQIAIHDTTSIVIFVRGSDLTGLGEFSSSDPSFLVNQWQQVVCSRINIEIGRRLNLALDDISMTMVESSELAGLRGRNLIGSLLDRLKTKFKFAMAEVSVEKLQQTNPLFLLQNHADNASEMNVWIFIDDIDSTYIDNENLRLKIATFFSAMRKLVTDVKGVSIRASVRTDVWTEIRRIDESLDKCEQYMVDILWSYTEFTRILVNKLHAYVKRTFPDSTEAAHWTPENNATEILGLVFSRKIPWGNSSLPTERAIHILAAGRPRWAGQLCRLAAEETARQHTRREGESRLSNHLITGAAFRAVMRHYGQYRLDDLYREHRHQFSALQSLIECFAGGQTIYTTDLLRQRILAMYMQQDSDKPQMPILYGRELRSELELCQFIYKIGFLHGRDDNDKKPLSFVYYEDRQDLLSNSNNFDDGMSWEIHPSYRTALNIKPAQRARTSDKPKPNTQYKTKAVPHTIDATTTKQHSTKSSTTMDKDLVDSERPKVRFRPPINRQLD